MFSLSLIQHLPKGAYPERPASAVSKWERWLERTAHVFQPMIHTSRYRTLLAVAEAHGRTLAAMNVTALKEETLRLRQELISGRWPLSLIAESFSLIRELAGRQLGQRHYDVQMLGGWTLINGMVAEMETGEGKTLTATLPACTLALAGVPVHVVTVNDYLASRDAEWMRPVYEALDLKVGVITHDLSPSDRQRSYACDVAYCTNKELVFDYLKDRLLFGHKPGNVQASLQRLREEGSAHQALLRGLSFAIVDEIDSVLIDEARTPLVISGQNDNIYETQVYRQAVELAAQLRRNEDFVVTETTQDIALTDAGRQRLTRMVDGFDSVWSGQRRREELICQGLKALHILHRDRDYLVRDGQIQIVDEFTGRVLPGRTWERGMHQMVETKEGCRLTAQKDTLARISYQRFFQRYQGIAGMTGTAKEVAGELWSVYGLRVVKVPTNRMVRRRVLPCRLHKRSEEKWKAVVKRIIEIHTAGRPVLIGTRSVEASEYLSRLLTDRGVIHRVLNAQQDQHEAEIIRLAGEWGKITVATNMAGRGTDIKLAPGVPELGGLHVIASEPHSARRIDRQLYGRCARQGDPGSCELFWALEDEVPSQLYGPGRRLAWLARIAAWGGGDSWLGRQLLHVAQWRIEHLH